MKMRMSISLKLFICIGTVLLLSGCSEHRNVTKSSDYNLKYEMAIKYYNDGDCFRSLPLLEELMSYFRMTEKGEDVYYYYAKTQQCLKDYYLASYYFKRFVKNYPNSPRAQECAFSAAICNMENSPEYNLDQSQTFEAINEFQAFMNRYPQSELVDSCNFWIKDLREKLERKSFEQGKLYFKMEKYRSAVIAFTSTLEKFPDTDYKEEILFLMVKSNFLFAENSIESKKQERYDATVKSYLTFVDSFKSSKWLKTAEHYYNKSLEELSKLQNTKDGI